MSKPHSQVIEHRVSKFWRWIVIPGDNPYIYIPFPNEFAARQVASELDRGEWTPETFIHKKVTKHMRSKYHLPLTQFPTLPDLPDHMPWHAVSAKRWGDLADDITITRTRIEIHEPGRGTRTLYLFAKQMVFVNADTQLKPDPLPRSA